MMMRYPASAFTRRGIKVMTNARFDASSVTADDEGVRVMVGKEGEAPSELRADQMLVATGRAELMTDDRLSPWDVAALLPIVEEAGGVFTDWRGASGRIAADGVASNAALATAFREALEIPEVHEEETRP